jgi:glycosyltransferase involved in cell wall biosynthesis
MKKKDEPLVSVFTCVYNGADKIDRVFNSLKSQTYTNMEHIIIDDGSTDNVAQKVQQYIAEVPYPVIYRYKENGGLHTAINMAWDNANGTYFLQLDADDELLPHAIAYLVGLWDEIPKEHVDEYWCVHGRCKTQNSDLIVGDPYPDGMNELSFEEARSMAQRCRGEKIGLMRADVLNMGKYRFPEPEEVKLVEECVIWKQVNKRYRTWYSNEIVRIYYVNEAGCLTHARRNSQTMNNKCWNYRWFLLHRKEYGCNVFRALLIYAACYPFTTDAYKEKWKYPFVDFKTDALLSVLLFIFGLGGRVWKPLTGKLLGYQEG